MKDTLLVVLAILFAIVGGLACGDGGGPTPPPAVQRVKAVVALEMGDPTVVPVSANQVRITFGDIKLTETAGTGVNLNYVELMCRWTRFPDYRAQVGANLIIDAWGSNRIEANGSLGGTVWFVVPLQQGLSGMRLTISMTDDLGNDLSVVGGVGSLAIKAYNEIAVR